MRKRSITIHGHQTSISLEDEFWDELSALAQARDLSLNALVTEVDKARDSPQERRRQSLQRAPGLCAEAGQAEDQSSLKPLRRTKAPKSARSGTEYCRALSSDQP